MEKSEMTKESCVKNFIVVLISAGCLFVTDGCKKTDDKAIKIGELSSQIAPLQAGRIGENIETITLNQAMIWHEALENNTSAESISNQQESPGHLCMGVLVGYQAIRYAVDQLFGQSVPQASDFEISVTGPMDGVWDMMSLYTGKELRFEGEPQPMDLKSFTFTARKISEDKSLVFGLRPGIIPEEFFELKNQGATCGNPELSKIKQQALLNILSVEPDKCFEVINNDSDAGQ
jgi:hypothetical protein